MGLLWKILSPPGRIWRAGVPCGERGFAVCRRSPDRGCFRRALSERCAWLWLFDGMGPCFRHTLVVSWSPHVVPGRQALAARLVGRPGQQVVRFAGGPHPFWADAWRHLRRLRSLVVAIVY